MKVWIGERCAYVDPTDTRGEAFWIDEHGRIGIAPTQDGRITWCAVRRDVFVAVEVVPPTPDQHALLALVSYGVSGPPDKH